MTNLDIFTKAISWYRQGYKIAIGTVIETWGSAPRPVGSLIVINDNMEFEGSISGGCVESAVIASSEAIFKDPSKPLILDYGIEDEEAWAVGLTCGGKLKIHLQSLDAHLASVEPHINTIDEGVYIRDLTTGFFEVIRSMSPSATSEHKNYVDLAFVEDKATYLSDRDIFIQPIQKNYEVFITGAVHVAQFLIPLLKNLNFDVTLIDPRPVFATQERFPNVNIIDQYPQDFLLSKHVHHRSALIALSHDSKIDNPAVEFFLKHGGGFYVGCLGSKKTHEKRVAFLNDQNIHDKDIKKIHAPIGLDLGGRSPSEIAISIASELIKTKYKD